MKKIDFLLVLLFTGQQLIAHQVTSLDMAGGLTVQVGYTTVFAGVSTGPSRRAEQITVPNAGMIESISIYHNGGTGGILLGVYSDNAGAPGTRLSVTPITAVNSTEGWQKVALENPVSVGTGQKVWLSWLTETALSLRWGTGSPGRIDSGKPWSGGMPTDFGAGTSTSAVYSLYANVRETPVNLHKTLYVSSTGSDIEGTGTEDKPYATIKKGVEVMNAGDSLLVLPGLYRIYETINLKSGIVISGKDAQSSILTLTDPFSTNLYYEGSMFYGDGISDVTICNLSLNYAQMVIQVHNGNRIKIHSCNIYEGDIYGEGISDVTICNLSLHFASIQVQNGNRIKIHSCNITEGAISLDGVTDSEIFKNTLRGNVITTYQGNVGVYISGTRGINLISNNIICGFDYSIVVEGVVDAPIITYNDVYGGMGYNDPYGHMDYSGICDQTGINGNIRMDPEFENYYETDNKLLPSSPCVNAGDPAFKKDPDGTNTEMGAVYFVNTYPIASFVSYPKGFYEVSFDGTASSAPEGTIVSWSWNFGDGQSGSGQKITHTYPADTATYTVTLKVTDNVAKTGLLSHQVIPMDMTGPTVQVGYTTVFAGVSTGPSRRAERITVPNAGMIKSISIYHNGGGGGIMLAVYSDNAGNPGTRLGVTPITAVNSTEGWQEVPLENAVSVVAGQKVWLSWLTETTLSLRWGTGTPGRINSNRPWSGGMPTDFGTGTSTSAVYSLYANVRETPVNIPKTLYVSTIGSDVEGTGTEDKPFATIKKGVEVMNAGDSLLVLPGSYIIYETTKLKSGIVISGKVAQSSRLILGEPSSLHLDESSVFLGDSISDVTICNLSFEFGGTFQVNNGNRIKIHSCNFTESSISMNGITDSEIFKNTIRGNVIEYKQNIGISISGTRGNNLISNNIICGFDKSIVVGGVFDAPRIRYNDVYGIMYDYNGIWDQTGLNGNISQDPEFENYYETDNKLLPSSPCVNAGDPAYKKDPDGSNTEMGAVYFVPNTYPIVSFTAEPRGYYEVFFDATASYDPDGTIVWWSWDFGDWQFESGEKTITHSYPVGAASYTVTLTVTDDEGHIAKVTQQVTPVDMTGVQTVPVGYTTVFSGVSTGPSRRAEQATILNAGQIQSLSIYHNGGSGGLLLAVYSDNAGAPGTRLGVTAATPVNSTQGWQEVALTSLVPATAGQKVWLSWLTEKAISLRWGTGSPGRIDSNLPWSGGMPATFGTGTSTSAVYSLYANVIIQGANAREASLASLVKEFKEDDSNQISVYPNPFTDHVNVDLQVVEENTLIQIALMDLNGRNIDMLINDRFDSGQHTIGLDQLDIRGIKSGVYILKIMLNENVYFERIIRQYMD